MPFSTNNVQPNFQTPKGYYFVGDTQENTGFTIIVPSVDTLQIFLGDIAHGGSDANDGLTDTTPKLTWDAAIGLIRTGIPDHLNVINGSVFKKADNLSNYNLVPYKSGRSSAERIIIKSYGPISDGRPIFENFDSNSTGAGAALAQRNLSYHGLNIDSTSRHPESDDFFMTLRMNVSDVVVGYTAGVTLKGTDGVEVVATYVIQGGDTVDDIATSIVSQLSATVGVTLTRFIKSSNEYVTIGRALPGTFSITIATANHDEFRPTDYNIYNSAGEGSFSWLSRSDGTNNDNIRLEDCILSDMDVGFQGLSTVSRSQNIELIRCIMPLSWGPNSSGYKLGARFSNAFLHNIAGLKIKECTNDYGGWHPDFPTAGANNRSHCVYIQNTCANDTEVIGNIMSRAASHGLMVRCSGLVEDNFVGRCSVGIHVGYDGDPLSPGDIAHVFTNVISEGVTMAKGEGVTNNTPFASGLAWALTTATDPDIDQGDVHLDFNITSLLGDASIDPYRSSYVALNIQSGTEYNIRSSLPESASAKRTNNIAYQWDEPTQTQSDSYVDPGRTLSSYYQHLVANGDIADLVTNGIIPTVVAGATDYDTMMDLLKSRLLLKWDSRLTSYAINSYIRSGFEIN